jgi:pyruvate/2-oxoglutarate dehydrogenase complex dihydrolipoamide acyltransferase (E2) component
MGEIKIDEGLWENDMVQEGLVERWFVADGADVAAGQAVVEVRIEDALHELLAPAAGRLTILAAVNDMIEPGSVVGRIAP